MNPKPLILTVVLLAVMVPAGAQIFVTEMYNFTAGSPAGLVSDGTGSSVLSQPVGASLIANLTEVRVSLSLAGSTAGQGWAGDIFVSLNRDLGGQTAILLNQAGVTGSDPAGYGFDGWNVTFQDNAANGDIHLGQPGTPGATLSGLWQPDGRRAPTDTVRDALLGVFNGATGNANWYLNVADLSPGGAMTLNSWSLTLAGFTAVPEPAHTTLLAGAGLLALVAWRRGQVLSRRR